MFEDLNNFQELLEFIISIGYSIDVKQRTLKDLNNFQELLEFIISVGHSIDVKQRTLKDLNNFQESREMTSLSFLLDILQTAYFQRFK